MGDEIAKPINAPKRIIRICSWGANYTYRQIEECIAKIEEEANINAIIAMKNRGQNPEKQIINAARTILKTSNEQTIAISQTLLKDIVQSIYPEVKYQQRELKNYEPHERMTALANILTGYKLISLSAYDKTKNILDILKFRTYISTILDENSIHYKAANKLREYLQISQPFNTSKQ